MSAESPLHPLALASSGSGPLELFLGQRRGSADDLVDCGHDDILVAIVPKVSNSAVL